MAGTGDDLEARLRALTPRQRELLERVRAERAAGGGRIRRRPPGTDRAPASFEQERLWFMDRLIPYRQVYYTPTVLRLEGALDAGALEWALNGVVARHEVLRTVFEEAEGRPVQVVLPEQAVALPVEDVSGCEDPEAEVRRRGPEEIVRPFDLAMGPPLRARLYRLGADDHVLLLTLHHIVSDAWSLTAFLGELEALYARRLGLPSRALPELPIQYADFATWQRERLAGPEVEGLLAWWRERMAGAPAVMELPLDHVRPPQRRAIGRFVPVRLERELVERVRGLGREEGATLHQTLLASFEAVLARYTGQRELVVGIPIAGRGRSEVEPLIGFFLNWLVLRTPVGDDPAFRELVGRVRDGALAAHAHAELPFELLVTALQPRRDLSTTPVFQVSFSVRDEQVPLPRFAGLGVGEFELAVSATHYDLMGDFWVEDGEVVGNLPYNEELFEEATIERLGERWKRLLWGAVSAPGRRISELPLLSDGERRWLLRPWDEVPPPRRARAGVGEARPRCLHERFAAEAAERPGAEAVSCEGERLTYGELERAASRLAHLLRERGVRPGARVAICLERSVDTVVAMLGVLKAGAAYLPLDPDHPGERLSYLMADGGASALVSQRGLASRLGERPAAVVWMDADRELLEAQPAHDPGVRVSPGAAAYVIYTSGSTGKPKGVLVSHGCVGRLFDATRDWMGYGPADVWALFHSAAFDFSVWEVWGALLHGGRVAVVPQWATRAPEAVLELVAEEGVTVLSQTPSAFGQLGRVALERAEGLPAGLRLVVFGGEALEPQRLRGWFERFGEERPRLVNMYGITETTVHVTYRPLGKADVAGAASVIGRPIPDLQAYVLGRGLEPVPEGVPGELYVGGAGLADGYLGRPGLTAERFLPDPYSERPGSRMYRSGDVGKLLKSGELAYVGRRDDQVKIRGHRIELGEVQAALARQPGVAEAVVVAREQAGAERRLVAYLVASGEGAPTVGQLRRGLGAELPEFMVPAAFVVLDRLPLTPNGKVDRRALPEPGGERPALEREYVAPRTDEERVVALALARTLRVERVGALDSFFELGGHSLLALQLLTALKRETGVALDVADVFRRPTVAQLAELLAGAAEAAPAPALDLEAEARIGDLLPTPLPGA